MNLQICLPYEKCVYQCPMCVARGKKHNYEFKDLYTEDVNEYLRILELVIRNYENCIITGECDPSQNMRFVKSVLGLKNEITNLKFELQTRNYNISVNELRDLDILSYSIIYLKDYLKSYSFPKIKNINRLVILLSNEFEFLTNDNFHPMGYNQITFKTLQYGDDPKINKWIDKNNLKDLTNIYEIVEKYNGTDISIRIDTSCQIAKGRYHIFRSDGKLYNTWEEK